MENIFYVALLIESSSVLSSFLSGILVLLIGSLLLPRYLRYLKRPKVITFFDKFSGKKIIARKSGGIFSFVFEPILKHRDGESLMNGVHWQICFPSFVDVTVQNFGRDTLPGLDVLEDGTKTFYGKFQIPIFQNTTTRLQYTFECEFSLADLDEHLHRFPLLCWFSTEHGDYPRKLKRLDSSGLIDYNSMDKIWVELMYENKE